MLATAAAHIWLDEQAVPWIDETRTKVIEVVADSIAHGWSPEEIHFQHPHLSLGQIHAALGYYHDHKEELDDLLRQSLTFAEQRRAEANDSPLRMRLRRIGALK